MTTAKKILIIPIIIISLTAIIYFAFKPNKPDKIFISHDMVLEQVEEIGKLELLKYNIRDIIEYKKERTWLPNSQTALIVVGEVVACIDLTQINKDDITIVDDSINLTLPLPEICYFKIDHNRSRVYDVQYGLWDTHQLVDEAYKEAELQIHRQAIDMGIAKESKQSAIKIITPILNGLGFKKVRIDFKDNEVGINDRQSINQNIIRP